VRHDRTRTDGRFWKTLGAVGLLGALAGMPDQSSAGQINMGTVSYIETNANDGFAYVTVDGWYDARPACSTFARQRFEIDTNSQGGRNALQNAFMARVMSRPVFAYGAGTCRSGGIDEQLGFLGLMP